MTAFCFQAQLASIMDALSKAAVNEIGKLVEIESKMLKIEITRGRNEIASLTEKLHLMETLLHMAQRGRQQDGREGSDGAANSEFPWQNISSSPETSTSFQDERRPATEVCPFAGCRVGMCSGMMRMSPQLAAEHPELVLQVKEEPTEVDDRELGREGASENNTQKSPDVSQRHKLSSERRLPDFLDCVVSLDAPSCLSSPQRRDAQWNPQLAPAQANRRDGKSPSPDAAPQSSLRTGKLHHLRTAASAKSFGCSQCGKSFRCFSQLEIHQRSHTGEKPFRCTLCGKRYAQKGHLYTHQRTHTGEKPYRCPVCGKGFIQKCTLDMHQRTHTGEKPFVCVQCGKGFTKNCNLKKHVLVHLESDLQLYGSNAALGGMFQNETSPNAVAGLV